MQAFAYTVVQFPKEIQSIMQKLDVEYLFVY